MRLGSKAFRQKLLATFFITASISIAFLLIFGRKNHTVAWSLPRVEGTFTGQVLSTAEITTPPQRTEEIAKEIARSLIAQNPTGPTITNGIAGISAGNPEKIANDVLNKKIEEITRSVLEPRLNTAAIKVLPISSPDSNTEYLRSRANIIQKSLQAVASYRVNLVSPSQKDFTNLLNVYDLYIEQLYVLPVPKNLVTIHKETLRLATAQRLIFYNISHYESDAINASVSLSLLEAVGQQEKEFGVTLNNFIQNNRLTP